MWGTHNLPLFLLTAVTLTLIPGPSTMYILGRSISQGPRAGVLSVLGIGAGSLCHTAAVAFGLSAVFAVSQTAFSVVKYAGAAYLIFLGLQTLRKNAKSEEAQELQPAQHRTQRIFGQGLLTQLLNPKVSIFFIALLPQFVNSGRVHSPWPFLFLGVLFVSLDTLWFLLIASCSAFFTGWLRQNTRVQIGMQRVTGLLYIGLGLNLLRLKAKLAS